MVVAIITILTGVFLLQQRQFDSSTLLRSLAYRTALSIREAQTYGASVRLSGTTAPAYGIYIQKPVSGAIISYVLFADADGGNDYDISEDLEVFTLGSNYSISLFCATQASNGVALCSNGALTSLTIIFVRPNPDARFSTAPAGVYTSAYIQISAQGGTTRSVTITNTGQISVGAPGS